MTKPNPPSWKERRKLVAKLQKQVDKLHGKDEDGSSRATVEVMDRRDGHWPYIRPVPRVPWENPTPEQLLAAIDAAGTNVESTARDFDQVRRDVQCYFEQDKRGRDVRAAVKEILGETAIVGRAYDRYDDAPRWTRWEPYRKREKSMNELEEGNKMVDRTCFFNNVNQHDMAAFKKWLIAGRIALRRKHGKRIKGWYVRTDGSIGISLSALVEVPEKDRPAIIARNRAKREYLEKHAEEIAADADRIEAELRKA